MATYLTWVLGRLIPDPGEHRQSLAGLALRWDGKGWDASPVGGTDWMTLHPPASPIKRYCYSWRSPCWWYLNLAVIVTPSIAPPPLRLHQQQQGKEGREKKNWQELPRTRLPAPSSQQPAAPRSSHAPPTLHGGRRSSAAPCRVLWPCWVRLISRMLAVDSTG